LPAGSLWAPSGLGGNGTRRHVQGDRYFPKFSGHGHEPERDLAAARKAPKDGVERMNRFWGDESWRDAAYAESRQTNLFSTTPELVKLDNAAIVNAFQRRLIDKAEFQFVPDPLAMRNSNNAVVYYLFFASQKPVAKNIIDDIFKKYGRR
jgi:three-Cys-motif partner protein